MAADGMMAADWTIISLKARKIFRLYDGSLIAGTGDTSQLGRFFFHLKNRVKEDELPFHFLSRADGTTAFVVRVFPSGRFVDYCVGGIQTHTNRYHAHGAGRDFALAAMDAGASAEEAVRIACKRSTACGGRVQTMRLKP